MREFEIINPFDLLEDDKFCDYIQNFADITGRTYSEVYDEILDNPTFSELVVDGWIRSGEIVLRVTN